nr:MAG: late transcription factor VLTF-4 [Equine parapoxvirus]WNT71227.1 MAG: late transcription factor VLTF-4 [Equine parapoxvirus]WNT71248.1 MAG: late transcription factor VLTF-4 [Equine parapoxvirus]
MSSWKLKMSKCSASSGVQTLDSLRARLRNEAMLGQCDDECDPRDDLFPEECLDELAPPIPVPEEVESPPVPQRKQRRTTKKDRAAPKPQPIDVCEDEPEAESPRAEPPEAEEQDPEQERREDDEMGESDLAVAFAAIMADMKALTARVKALSSVLSDVQAAGVKRSFTGLSKALIEASEVAGGLGKGPAAPRKKKAAAKK